jgi:hypothetical protein
MEAESRLRSIFSKLLYSIRKCTPEDQTFILAFVDAIACVAHEREEQAMKQKEQHAAQIIPFRSKEKAGGQ